MRNGSFRKKKVYYSQISNTAIRDTNLSLQAKGLYAIIQSYITIPDFTLYKNHLIKISGVSENTFNKYWKELKDKKYLVQYRYYEEGIKGAQYEYELFDEPTIIEGVNDDKAEDEKAPIIKEENTPVVEEENEEIYTPQNLRCKKLSSKNSTPKNLGGHNNTDLNNTDYSNNDDISINLSKKNKKATYCNSEEKEIVEEKIDRLNEYMAYSYKRLDLIKFLNAAYGDTEIIEYVYDNIIQKQIYNEKPIQFIVAYIVKSIENEIKKNGL